MKFLRIKIAANFLIVIYSILTLAMLIDYFGAGVMQSTGPTAAGFALFAVGIYVNTLPITASVVVFLLFFLRPVQQTANAYLVGDQPPRQLVIKTKKRIHRLPQIIITADFVAFALGSIVTMATSRPTYLAQFFSPKVLLYVTFVLAGSLMYAFTQISLNNIALSPLREALSIHYFDNDKQRELSMSKRLLIFIALASVYMLSFSTHIQIVGFESLGAYADTLEQAIRSGQDPAQFQDAYIAAVAPGSGVPAFPIVDQGTLMGGLSAFLVTNFFTLIVIVLGCGLVVTREFASQLSVQQKTLNNIQRGVVPASTRIGITHFDEIGSLSDAINRFMDSFQGLVRSVVDSAHTVSTNSEELGNKTSESSAAMEEIAASVRQISSLAQGQRHVAVDAHDTVESIDGAIEAIVDDLTRQQGFVEETSSAMTEMAESIRSVSDNAAKVENVAEELRSLSQGGGSNIDQTKHIMGQISESSEVVQQIVGVLQNVANQTNLLAMNAAIEAAHAGNAGRGFAVVADEIRKLAESSSKQSKEIVQQIKTMDDRVGQGLAISEKTGQAFEEIEAGIETTTRLIKEVASAILEQRTGAEQITREVNNVVEGNAELRQLVENLKDISVNVREKMQNLVGTSEEVHQATEQQNINNKTILELVVGVRENAEANMHAVTQLSGQVKQFDV